VTADRTPPSASTRPRRPLTPAHKELIRLLAKIAVENYLAEIEHATRGHEDDKHSKTGQHGR
jgi:hypothetical protein